MVPMLRALAPQAAKMPEERFQHLLGSQKALRRLSSNPKTRGRSDATKNLPRLPAWQQAAFP